MPPFLLDAYSKVAPHPEDWPTLVAKMAQLALAFKGWSSTDIRSISAPTLVIAADRDIVRIEHTVELFRMLPHGQLAVLPGTNHFSYLLERPEQLLSMISAFLDAPVPKTT
jgi:pimeloyl-ACP methyl ester carboxylesterase